MLEAITTTIKPASLFTDAELLSLCDAFDGQLVECQTALAGATDFVESWTNRSLLSQTKRVTYSAWPELGLELPQGPVVSITSVTVRSGDAAATFDNVTGYRFAETLDPPRLMLRTTAATIDEVEDAVSVVYVAGVASRGDAAGIMVSAVERLTKHLFEHPGDTEGDFCRALKNYLRPARVANINGVR